MANYLDSQHAYNRKKYLSDSIKNTKIKDYQ